MRYSDFLLSIIFIWSYFLIFNLRLIYFFSLYKDSNSLDDRSFNIIYRNRYYELKDLVIMILLYNMHRELIYASYLYEFLVLFI